MNGNSPAYKVKRFLFTSLLVVSVLFFILICAFFLLTLVKAISPAVKQNVQSASINIPYLLKTTGFTFAQSLLSLLLALTIGIPASYFVSQKNFPLKKFLCSFSAVPLCVPALIIALGYISTFGISGIVNKFLMNIFHLKEAPLTFLYSFWGIVICQGFYNFPLIMLTTANCWSSIDEKPADCARLLGAGKWKIFRTVTVWQLLPGIISSCIPVFIYCFFSFMIVQLFGGMDGTTLEVSIYHAAKSTLDFKLTALLALIETLCAFTVLFLYNLFENKNSEEKNISLNSDSNCKKIQPSEIPGFIFFAIIIFIFFLLPILCILISSITVRTKGILHFSLINWKRLFAYKSFLPSLKNTFITGLCTASLCTICGCVFSLLVFRKNNTLIKTVSILPMAVSSVVTGFGIMTLVPQARPLHLILCQTALTWPFAYRQIFSSMKKIPEDTINAGFMFSQHPTNLIFNILLPYSRKGILSAFGFCFAISAGDATIPLMLSIPKFDTLALFTYRLAGSYRINEACASGIILGLLCMGIFSLTEKRK